MKPNDTTAQTNQGVQMPSDQPVTPSDTPPAPTMPTVPEVPPVDEGGMGGGESPSVPGEIPDAGSEGTGEENPPGGAPTAPAQ